MNTNINEGIALAASVNNLTENKKCKIIIAPPLTHLSEIQKVVNTDKINISAQNCAKTKKWSLYRRSVCTNVK